MHQLDPISFVAQLTAENVVGGLAMQEFHILLQAHLVLLKDAAIPVLFPHVPDQQRISSFPAQIRGIHAVLAGDRGWQSAVRPLGVRNVADEVGVERRHVEVHHGFLRGRLRVSHPALALIALVAIGGNAEQVGELGPANQLLDVVEDLL